MDSFEVVQKKVEEEIHGREGERFMKLKEKQKRKKKK